MLMIYCSHGNQSEALRTCCPADLREEADSELVRSIFAFICAALVVDSSWPPEDLLYGK